MTDTAPLGDKIERKFTVSNKLGLHARPAALFVRTANGFRSEVLVRKGRQKVNGKSIMGIMTLAAQQGSHITVVVHGPDAALAMEEIARLIEGNFGE